MPTSTPDPAAVEALSLARELSPTVELRRHYGLRIKDAEVYAQTILASDWLGKRDAVMREKGEAAADRSRDVLVVELQRQSGTWRVRAQAAEERLAAVLALADALDRDGDEVLEATGDFDDSEPYHEIARRVRATAGGGS